MKVTLIDIDDFPAKFRKPKARVWPEIEKNLEHLISNPTAVLAIDFTNEELQGEFARYNDPKQAIFKELKRDSELKKYKLGVRTTTKVRHRGERAEIDLIGISRSFWKDGTR